MKRNTLVRVKYHETILQKGFWPASYFLSRVKNIVGKRNIMQN